jgi:hypothetical protein
MTVKYGDITATIKGADHVQDRADLTAVITPNGTVRVANKAHGTFLWNGPLKDAVQKYNLWTWDGAGWLPIRDIDDVLPAEDKFDIETRTSHLTEPDEDPKPILSSIAFEDHDRMTSTLKDYLEELMSALRMAPELVITSSQGYFHLDSWRVDDIDDGDAWILAGDEVSSPSTKPERIYLLGSTLLQVTIKSTK